MFLQAKRKNKKHVSQLHKRCREPGKVSLLAVKSLSSLKIQVYHFCMWLFVSLQTKFFLWMAFSSVKEIDTSSNFKNIMTINRWKLSVQLSSLKSSQTLICEKFSSNIALIKTVDIMGPAFHTLEV